MPATMMKVPFSYLSRQFAEIDPYLDDLRELVVSGDLTLGKCVGEFEERFAAICNVPYAVGVGSGTDALILSLKILGVGPGDEVITTTNTFVATVGAIAMTGATPVFVDCDDAHVIDHTQIEAKITEKTKAILPVHWTGTPPNLPAVVDIAERHNLRVVEDCAQGILAAVDGRRAGGWGDTGCFSLHPLKNLNVWGDAGIIVTRSAELYEKLQLFRNHGLATRDDVVMWGHNSRLDSLQAVIGNRLIDDVYKITDRRIENAQRYDAALSQLDEFITIPTRRPEATRVFHLYVVQVERRDELLAYLKENGVGAKIHYPIPMHLQPAAKPLGYQAGDFPVAEEYSRTAITLPAHQHLSDEEVDYVIDCIREFYGR